MSRELTFARLDALSPRVIEIGVAGISTFIEPSTAASTAAGLAGFRKGATLATRTRGISSRSSACRGIFCERTGIKK